MINVITEKEIIKELQEALVSPPRMVIVDYEDIQVNYGLDAKPNFEYCKEHSISCVDIGRRGGAFVVNKGDIGLGYVAKGLDNTIGYLVSKRFTEYLKNKGLNAHEENNDILIDGYKVFGWASHYYKEQECIFISCHFTMSVDLDLIEKICTKPINKTPKGLSCFGITREEVQHFICSLF